MDAPTTTQPDRQTEAQLRCPHCHGATGRAVPRFLAGLTGDLQGTLRIPCAKCRKHVTYDLETLTVLEFVNLREFERELRCGSCRGFLAGVVAVGEGTIRVPCTDPECKRRLVAAGMDTTHLNTFKVSARQAPVRVEAPVS